MWGFYVLYPCYTTCSILKRDHFTAVCTFRLTWGPTGLHAKRWEPNEDRSNYHGMAVIVLQVNMMHHDHHESDVSSFCPDCALENSCSASSNSGYTAQQQMLKSHVSHLKTWGSPKKLPDMATYRHDKAPLQAFSFKINTLRVSL